MKRFLLFFTFTICFLNAQFIKEPIFNEVSYVETFGNPNNEAIVFVHGLGDEASDIWKTSVEALKDEYFIMIFDLPGFGKSDKSNQLYSPSKYANFINTLVDNFVDKPFHLVGHSMGASISLLYASLYDSRLKTLTLIDAAAILDKSAYSEFLLKHKLKSKSMSDVVSSLSGAIDDIFSFELDSILNKRITRKFLLRSNPNTIAAMALVNEDFSSIPRRLEVPTLIIWGKEDKVAPLRTGQTLHYLLPKSKLEIFENSAHVPMTTQFDKYLDSLKTHFQSNNYTKNKKRVLKKALVREVKNEQNINLSGNFKKLVIKDSKNVKIINSKIEQLILINSSVEIINSDLNFTKKSQVEKSKLIVTASELNTKYPIEIEDSALDFAGVNVYSLNDVYKAKTKNKQKQIVYSLCEVNGKNIHGIYNIDFK